MTDDIIERLRDKDGRWLSQYCKPHQLRELRDEAATEIERLRIDLDNATMAHRNFVEEYRQQQAEIERLRRLIRTMIEEDPNELAADGGVTVLDVWRKEAIRSLEPKP